tara:strand:- start:12427 stop:14778 length:2352 start_codon:yes stop_codon:yes gene_type:complete
MAERFTDAYLDELRSALPITRLVGEYVTYEAGKGREGDQWACCPFHGESTPSFHATDDKQSYHCFGCGVSGDHFEFLIESQGMTFPEAVQTVAELAGIPLPEGVEIAKGPARAPEHPRAEKTPPQPSAVREKKEMVKVYPYTDNDGELLYEVCRIQIRMPDGSWARTKDGKGTWKDFRQRRPSGMPDGSKVWGLREGEYIRPAPGKDWSPWDRDKADKWSDHQTHWFDAVEHTIYRHPQVEIAIAEGRPVIITEGEKDAETVETLGFTGTTNSSGSKHWNDTHAACFKGADVIIALDNDAAGARADKLARSMTGIARRIRVLDFAEHVPNFPVGNDITDWVEAGGTTNELEKIIACLPDWRSKLPEAFGCRPFKSIAGEPIEYEWMIEELIEHNGVLVFAGAKGAGKTFAALDMGMKVAQGLPYAGRETRRGIVIHIAVEDGAGVRMRAEGYRRYNGISPDEDIPYVIMDREFSLMSDDAVTKMIAAVAQISDHYRMPVELIIIDTWSVATEGLNEIDGAEVGKVLARINRLKESTGATICLVHHMNATGNRVRGHTSIEANVSNVIEIKQVMTVPERRGEDPVKVCDQEGRPIRQLTLTKNKNGLDDIKWSMALEIVDLGLNRKGKPVSTCVCVSTKRPRQSKSRSKITSQFQRILMDALNDALSDAGKQMPPNVRVGPQIQLCVAYGDWRDYVRRRWPFKSPEDDAEARDEELRKSMAAAEAALLNAGYLGKDNDVGIVWSLGKDRQTTSYLPQDDPEPPPSLPDDVQRELAEVGHDEPPF